MSKIASVLGTAAIALFCAVTRTDAQPAGAQGAIPDFAADSSTAWVLDRTRDDLLPPVSGPGPITFDQAHPYIPNGHGPHPTYRVSDVGNPILQPWAAAQMKKTNDDVLAGKVPFRAREAC